MANSGRANPWLFPAGWHPPEHFLEQAQAGRDGLQDPLPGMANRLPDHRMQAVPEGAGPSRLPCHSGGSDSRIMHSKLQVMNHVLQALRPLAGRQDEGLKNRAMAIAPAAARSGLRRKNYVGHSLSRMRVHATSKTAQTMPH